MSRTLSALTVGPYVKKHAVFSTHHNRPSVLRTFEDIIGTEHLNLNTYYARPMADVFDTHSDGKWSFNAVASVLSTSAITSLNGRGM
jgi:hypothetical protein